jgi:chromate transporter
LTAPAGTPTRPQPRSPADLFVAFTKLALQGFGGVLAVAQRELVERRAWLSREEFLELVSAAQVLPGPNVVNLSLMFGDRCFGLRGAIAALAGMLAVPLVIVLLLASLYAQHVDVPVLAGALRGMGAVAAGLIIATALKLLAALKASPLGRPLCLALMLLTLVVVAGLRWPLVVVVCGLGSLAITLAWLKLAPGRPEP